jgi:hypothetical protein
MIPAAASAQASDMVELTRTVLRADKKVVLAENMWLTEAESEAFWPIYNVYEAELSKINGRVIKLLKDYAENFDTLSDEQAEDIIDENFSIKKKKLSLRKKYAGKFGKVIPQKKVFRFIQLEIIIESLVNYSISANLPYME